MRVAETVSDRATLGTQTVKRPPLVATCPVLLTGNPPRQDDLLALLDQVGDEITPEELAKLQISLRPD
jgi:hypothetical protein